MELHLQRWQLFILFLIPLLDLLHISFFVEAQNNSWCFDDVGNYTANSVYESNLRSVFSSLPSRMTNTGFYNTSLGESPDRLTVTAVCPVDMPFSYCLYCIGNATSEIIDGCPYRKQATRFKDWCTLRYSNSSLFGVLSEFGGISVWALERVSNIQEFNNDLGRLLSGLRDRAAAGGSLLKVAADNIAGPDFITIYALLQCTPDLTADDCNRCLSTAIQRVPGCCNGSIGVAVLLPSCRLNYGNSGLYNLTRIEEVQALSLPQPPPPPQTSPVPPPPPRGNSLVIIISIIAAIAVASLVLVAAAIFIRRKKMISKKQYFKPDEDDEGTFTMESLQYSYDAIKAATNDFSLANKLGQGGFGAVYKGKLENGREIAVKRLSSGSSQGDIEFKNEVMLLAKLRHRNLVKLYGFAIQGDERLLIYEYMKNGSLDHFIFDLVNRSKIDAEKRYHIIKAIAKGILYMHEHSRLRIIHRDLKPSNILLDGDMNPRIADFGLARLFVFDETHGCTSRIVGTPGYMAPEYHLQGEISIKIDVYSFGVLVLEIVTGKKNSSFMVEGIREDMMSFAWRRWQEGKTESLIDPVLSSGLGLQNMMKCIHIALLCVQKNAVDRPTMAKVILMLMSSTITMPLPSLPAYFISDSSSSREAVTTRDASLNEMSESEMYPR